MIGWISRQAAPSGLLDPVNRHLVSKKSLGAVTIVVSTSARTLTDIMRGLLPRGFLIYIKSVQTSPNSRIIRTPSSKCHNLSEIILSCGRSNIKVSLKTLIRIVTSKKKMKKRRMSSLESHSCKRKSMKSAASSSRSSLETRPLLAKRILSSTP